MKTPSTMRALQLFEPGRLREAQLPIPPPGPDDVLIRTSSTTICTSDLNDIAHNPFGIVLPRVLGHEGAGVIAAIGEKVQGFRPGDAVAAHPVIPCRQCGNCRRGLEHLCSRMGHLGLDRDGTFAEYFCIRADRVRRVPAGTSLHVASLLEPVAVCLEAVERGRIQPGDTVLVVGDGPFGILIARLATRCRPGKVILVGRHSFRLAQAPGAIPIHEKQTLNIREAVWAATNGQGADAAVMAAGTQAALDLCLASLRARGRAVIFSAIQGEATFDLFRVHTQELDILGACNDLNLIDSALACLMDPDLKLSSLVTHRLPFDQWERAFELARHGKDEVLKVSLNFAEGE